VKLGIITPVVTANPRAHASWERDAGIAEIEHIVVEADRLGYDHCTCSEHVGIPEPVVAIRGGTYWDPLAVFGYLAARTSTIRFTTYVLVLAYNHPLAIAKRYGTLDQVSGGRVILGVGVGSLREEFELLDAPFDDRGPRGDDAIRALRASFGQREPSYHGTHYSFDGFVIDPPGLQTDVPIWIGGRTARSLRRAVELGDGWAPFSLTAAEVAPMMARARDTAAWEQRTTPLDVVLRPDRAVDPQRDPDATRAVVEQLRDAGATMFAAAFIHHSADHYCEQLAALAEIMR